MGTSSQSHDDVHLKILPTLLEVCIRQFPIAVEKSYMKVMIILMNSQILNALLSINSTSSEILLLNYVQKTLF